VIIKTYIKNLFESYAVNQYSTESVVNIVKKAKAYTSYFSQIKNVLVYLG